MFYAPDIETSLFLPEEESQHAVKVLRLQAGDRIELIDGKGGYYKAEIIFPHHKRCEIQILEKQAEFHKRPYHLHIAIAPTKNIERLEWFAEKVTEIGIDEITPVICRFSERKIIKHDRLEKILISAMKQSLKALGTVLNPPRSFNEFISAPSNSVKMIAHCNESFNNRVSISQVCKKGDNVVILIGPEGDFTDLEIDAAIRSGYLPIHLGKSRLRTETAGICACHSVYFMNM